MKILLITLLLISSLSSNAFAAEISMELNGSSLNVFDNRNGSLVKSFKIFDSNNKITNSGKSILLFLLGVKNTQGERDFTSTNSLKIGGSIHSLFNTRPNYEELIGLLIDGEFPCTDAGQLFRQQRAIYNDLTSKGIISADTIYFDRIKPGDLNILNYNFINNSRAKNLISFRLKQGTKLRNIKNGVTVGVRTPAGTTIYPTTQYKNLSKNCMQYDCLKISPNPDQTKCNSSPNSVCPLKTQIAIFEETSFLTDRLKEDAYYITCMPRFDYHTNLISQLSNYDFYRDDRCKSDSKIVDRKIDDHKIENKEFQLNFKDYFKSASTDFVNAANTGNEIKNAITDNIVNNVNALPKLTIAIEVCSTTVPLGPEAKKRFKDNFTLNEKRFETIEEQIKKQIDAINTQNKSNIEYEVVRIFPEDENMYFYNNNFYRTGTCGALSSETNYQPDWVKYLDGTKNKIQSSSENSFNWINLPRTPGGDENLSQYRKASVSISYKQVTNSSYTDSKVNRINDLRCIKCNKESKKITNNPCNVETKCRHVHISGVTCLYIK